MEQEALRCLHCLQPRSLPHKNQLARLASQTILLPAGISRKDQRTFVGWTEGIHSDTITGFLLSRSHCLRLKETGVTLVLLLSIYYLQCGSNHDLHRYPSRDQRTRVAWAEGEDLSTSDHRACHLLSATHMCRIILDNNQGPGSLKDLAGSCSIMKHLFFFNFMAKSWSDQGGK